MRVGIVETCKMFRVSRFLYENVSLEQEDVSRYIG